MLLGTGGATLEVGPHARHGRVGVLSGELQLDVAVELEEALLAPDLRPIRAEEAEDEVVARSKRNGR